MRLTEVFFVWRFMLHKVRFACLVNPGPKMISHLIVHINSLNSKFDFLEGIFDFF